jgi:hypothetical protein
MMSPRKVIVLLVLLFPMATCLTVEAQQHGLRSCTEMSRDNTFLLGKTLNYWDLQRYLGTGFVKCSTGMRIYLEYRCRRPDGTIGCGRFGSSPNLDSSKPLNKRMFQVLTPAKSFSCHCARWQRQRK